MAIQVVGLFCEDVREEKSGQLSLVGLFPDNINIEPVNPGEGIGALFPKIALFIRINMNVDEAAHPMVLKLLLPNSQEIVLGNIDQDLIDKSKAEAAKSHLPFAGIRQHAVLQGFVVPQSGPIIAAVEMGSQQFKCAVLNINLSWRSTASEPPASRSQSASPGP